MHIPSYQIRNVLKVYSRQLSQKKNSDNTNSDKKKHSNGNLKLSVEGKRQVVLDRVVADIIIRIINSCPLNQKNEAVIDPRHDETEKNIDFDQTNEGKFVFNTITPNNEKVTNVISVEDENFLTHIVTPIGSNRVGQVGNHPSEDLNENFRSS